MSTRVCVFVLLAPIALTLACNRITSPSATPLDVSGAASTAMPSTNGSIALSAVKSSIERLVNIEDACDPETFNAVIGPGTCVRSGGVVFPMFLDQLRRHGSIGAWHFGPPDMTLHQGDRFVAVNHGGETHTFTEVEEFGGGIVPLLNEAIGLTTVAPECQVLAPRDFIAAGATFQEEGEDEGEQPGIVKYQCCIHPWMRLNARVLAK
jgi:plastocyanin